MSWHLWFATLTLKIQTIIEVRNTDMKFLNKDVKYNKIHCLIFYVVKLELKWQTARVKNKLASFEATLVRNYDQPTQ